MSNEKSPCACDAEGLKANSSNQHQLNRIFADESQPPIPINCAGLIEIALPQAIEAPSIDHPFANLSINAARIRGEHVARLNLAHWATHRCAILSEFCSAVARDTAELFFLCQAGADKPNEQIRQDAHIILSCLLNSSLDSYAKNCIVETDDLVRDTGNLVRDCFIARWAQIAGAIPPIGGRA